MFCRPQALGRPFAAAAEHTDILADILSKTTATHSLSCEGEAPLSLYLSFLILSTAGFLEYKVVPMSSVYLFLPCFHFLTQVDIQ